MLSIIVAIANNNVIGKDNKLIWHLPEDLKRFKNLTTGHNIIMGRKTFESLGRVLPNRKHIVLCNDVSLNIENENVEVLSDVNLLDKYIKSDEENFVIGGNWFSFMPGVCIGNVERFSNCPKGATSLELCLLI